MSLSLLQQFGPSAEPLPRISAVKRKHLEIEKDDVKTEHSPDVKTPQLPEVQPRSTTSDMCAEGCPETLVALLEQANQDKSGDFLHVLFVCAMYS